MTALYTGCEKFTVLTFIVKLYGLKVSHGWSEKSFTELLQLLQEVLPSGNKIPNSTYHVKKIINALSLNYRKINACQNNCILYWREHEAKINCPTCGASRYKVEKNPNKERRKVPNKVWIRIFHMLSHSTNKTRFLYLRKNCIFVKNLESPSTFIYF